MLLYREHEQGFTLVELLIAMAISGVVLGAVVTAFSTQRKAYDLQENLTEMVLNARVGMEMITREARVAGYDPSGAGFDAMPYQSTTLQIQADLNGDGDIVDLGLTISSRNSAMAFDSKSGSSPTTSTGTLPCGEISKNQSGFSRRLI